MIRAWRLRLGALLLAVVSVAGGAVSFAAQPASAGAACPTKTHPARGAHLAVPGIADRPTYLELSPDPNAPLIVMLHGMSACVEIFQLQSKITTTSTGSPVNLLWLSGNRDDSTSTVRSWHNKTSKWTSEYFKRAIDQARLSGVKSSVVVAAGFSEGAIMAQNALCNQAQLSDGSTYDGTELFQGIVVVVGTHALKCARRTSRSIMIVGSSGDHAFGTGQPAGGAKVNRLQDSWLKNQTTCPSEQSRPDAVVREPSLTTNMWVNCSAMSMVRSVIVNGFGHGWPVVSQYDVNVDMVRFAKSLGHVPTTSPITC